MILMCFRFKNAQFEIAATADPGVFEVGAKFMGIEVEKVELIFQVSDFGKISKDSFENCFLFDHDDNFIIKKM